MTPLRFEQLYQSEWQELETLLDQVLQRKTGRSKSNTPVRGEAVAALYRRACEHLALARARSYPAYLRDRLDRLTCDAHQVIYQRREFGIARLKYLITEEFPRSVRAHAVYVWISAALLVLPMLAVGWLVYRRPELILSLVDAETAASFEQMYSNSAASIGRHINADTDWIMLGYYIRHNIGIAFQCFAGGLFAGLGSLFFLVYNGANIGAVAGYLTERDLSGTFYSFVATHSAFELTAIVLSGAAGLRLGYALLAPGARTRTQSLVCAASECAALLYGTAAMLFIAATIEAFWSSASWIPHAVKYSVAGICWLTVLGYLLLQGRSAD
jgi:uncharacterized membrane protein SpoIIM required for sporulation